MTTNKLTIFFSTLSDLKISTLLDVETLQNINRLLQYLTVKLTLRCIFNRSAAEGVMTSYSHPGTETKNSLSILWMLSTGYSVASVAAKIFISCPGLLRVVITK